MTIPKDRFCVPNKLIVFASDEHELDEAVQYLTTQPSSHDLNLKEIAIDEDKVTVFAFGSHDPQYSRRLKIIPSDEQKPHQTEAIFDAVQAQLAAKFPQAQKPRLSLNLLGGIANHAFGAGHGGGPLPLKGRLQDTACDLAIHIPALDDLPSGSEEVHVFILDTVPANLSQLQENFPYDSSLGEDTHFNALMARTINYNFDFDSQRYPDIEDEKLVDEDSVSKDGANIRFDAHGLVISGIVRSIAPEAHIHLIRVLNDHGVGSLDSLRHGLEVVHNFAKTHSHARVVVNMSLMFGVPEESEMKRLRTEALRHNEAEDAPDEKSQDKGWKNTWALLKEYKVLHGDEKKVGEAHHELEHIFEHYHPIWRLLESLNNLGADDDLTFIAAAGNYRKEPALGVYKFWTRFPANCNGVYGVGAVQRSIDDKFEKAKYSVDADKFIIEAIYTLGGDEPNYVTAKAESQPEEESVDPTCFLLGLYVESPFCRWWAGTSFAAAILTGATACYLTQRGSRAQNFLQSLPFYQEKGRILAAYQPLNCDSEETSTGA